MKKDDKSVNAMKKTLVLVNEKKYFFLTVPPNVFFDIDIIYKGKYVMFPLWFRKKRKGLTYYKFGKLGDWKRHIKEYDRVIVLDSSYSKQIDRIIQNNYFEKGCFFFFWNKVHADPEFARKQLSSIESKFAVYSFSKTDCIKYNLRYNSTFYFPIELKNGEKFIEDVVFIGAAKREERLRELDAICGVFNKMKIKAWIHVCGMCNYQPQNFVLSMESIDYSEYLRVVSNARVILDIDVWKEKSCSLRAMEALFFDKKYITNNANIKEERFYNSKNVFILGEDNLNQLHDFIFSEVKPVGNDIKEYYLMNSWIERFKK